MNITKSDLYQRDISKLKIDISSQIEKALIKLDIFVLSIWNRKASPPLYGTKVSVSKKSLPLA